MVLHEVPYQSFPTIYELWKHHDTKATAVRALLSDLPFETVVFKICTAKLWYSAEISSKQKMQENMLILQENEITLATLLLS